MTLLRDGQAGGPDGSMAHQRDQRAADRWDCVIAVHRGCLTEEGQIRADRRRRVCGWFREPPHPDLVAPPPPRPIALKP